MALFRRKKDAVLPEVEKYYEAERRDRSGLAWLLALVSILVVAGLIVGLFFAGRWVFNTVTNDSDETSQTTGSDAADLPSIDGGPATNGGTQNSDTDAPADADEQTPDDSNATSEAADESTSPNSTPLAATGTNELPNTGAGSLVGIFAGVSTVAGGTHYVVQRRRATKR